jgi:hypothetical protein
MKKILLFAILLSISSGTDTLADFYLTDSAGNIEVFLVPSNTVELWLWYTNDPIKMFDMEVDVTGPGTILGGEITATGVDPALNWVGMPGTVYGYDIELNAATETGSLGSGFSHPLATIDFRCDGVGDVTLDLYNIFTCDSEYNEIIPICRGMIIHQIPEPASATILAVGLFFIANKKKKH